MESRCIACHRLCFFMAGHRMRWLKAFLDVLRRRFGLPGDFLGSCFGKRGTGSPTAI